MRSNNSAIPDAPSPRIARLMGVDGFVPTADHEAQHRFGINLETIDDATEPFDVRGMSAATAHAFISDDDTGQWVTASATTVTIQESNDGERWTNTTHVLSAEGKTTLIDCRGVAYLRGRVTDDQSGTTGKAVVAFHADESNPTDSDAVSLSTLNVYTATASYTVQANDNVIILNSATAITLTLETTIGDTGRTLFIKNIGTGVATIDGSGSETIDNELTQALQGAKGAIIIVNDGSEWWAMSFIGDYDFGLEVSLGNVSGYAGVNKFGHALDCDTGVPTDIWDGADGTTSSDIWLAPTVARIHAIVSTSSNDGGVGSGMGTVRVYGLKDWDTKESSEVVSLNGTSPVNTINSYVIIHRMEGQTFGSGGTNAGIITATAATDGTITAAIQAGEGQSLMAIFGVPSVQTLHISHIYAVVLRATGSAAKVDARLLVKENADSSLAGFITKEKYRFSDAIPLDRDYHKNPKKITGPAIVKVQVDTDAANLSITAAFDGYLVDN